MGTLRRINLDPAGPQSWDMDAWVGQPALPFVEEFNGTHTFGSLHPCAGAKAAVARLYAAGHRLHVLTSCSDDPITIRRREQNLDRLFGDVFTSITCLPLGVSKGETLSQFAPGAVWIEDNYRNARAGVEFGHDCWMMRRNHNRGCEIASAGNWEPEVKWIDDFGPILDTYLPTKIAA